MRKYEIMFIVKPTLDEAAIKKVAEDAKGILTKNGAKVVEEKDLGQRDLAYEINKFNKGYYFLYVIETEDAKAINEFNHTANVSEDIIRSLVTKIED